MLRSIVQAVVGSIVGFGLGFLVYVGIAFCGTEPPAYMGIVLGTLGAVAGGTAFWFLEYPPGRARAVSRWCVLTSFVVGGVGFLAGFIGPAFWYPDSNLGPLLGIFATGPFGSLAGAILGALVGALVHLPSRPVTPGAARP